MKALARTVPATFAPLLVVLAMLQLSSCTYDPYAYNDGYYDAAPMVAGLALVATSSSWWGYDPYRYCYYDYRRHCYYDPWARCYYPRGYRPRPIVGCPHPHNWRPGHGVCPHPRNVTNTRRPNDSNRIATLQQRNLPWSLRVRHNEQSLASHMRNNPSAWQNRVTTRSQSSRRVTLRPDSNATTAQTQTPRAGRSSSTASSRAPRTRGGNSFNTPVSTGQSGNRSVRQGSSQPTRQQARPQTSRSRAPQQQASRQRSASRQSAPQATSRPASKPSSRSSTSASKSHSSTGGGRGRR